MGEVHRLPDAEEAEREASVWFARMSADDVSSDDRARFEAWRSARPCNAKAYADLSGTWQELVKAGPLVRAVSFGQSMNAASSPPSRSTHRWTAIAVAAGVAALVLGVALNLYWQKEQTRVQTAVGERAQVALPDGSSFDLNTNSRVWVDYNPRRRVIFLERGEAFFKVAHDTQRPFWVHAGGSWVRAVGTAFNVYLRPTGPVVTVSEGTVKVLNATSDESPPTGSAVNRSAPSVTAGEQVDVHGRAEMIHALNAAQLSRLLAWRQGSVDFEDQALGDVTNELMRYTTLQIEFDDETLRALRVGGTFQTSPEGAEALLTMLHDGFGLTIQRDGYGRVHIEGPANR